MVGDELMLVRIPALMLGKIGTAFNHKPFRIDNQTRALACSSDKPSSFMASTTRFATPTPSHLHDQLIEPPSRCAKKSRFRGYVWGLSDFVELWPTTNGRRRKRL